MDVTVQQLRYFVAVAEELHFTRAAARQHITASSLSHQIAELERRMQVTLFTRTSRHVELSPAGLDLLPLARRATTSVDDVLSWVQARQSAGQMIRVGLFVGNTVIAEILSRAAAALPGVQFDVRRLGRLDAATAVRDGDVDVALAPALRPPTTAGTTAQPLWTDARVLVVGAHHRFADRTAVTAADLAGEDFVGISSIPGVVDEWFDVSAPATGGRSRVVTLVDNFEEVLDYCSAGLASNLSGASAAATFARADLRFIPVPELPEVTFYVITHSSARSGVVPVFARIAREVSAATNRATPPG